jgi:hypothetical protein
VGGCWKGCGEGGEGVVGEIGLGAAGWGLWRGLVVWG